LRLLNDKAGVFFVAPYQQGSSGTGNVSVDMQKIWALSGTEGVSLSTQVIKASSDTEGCLTVHLPREIK